MTAVHQLALNVPVAGLHLVDLDYANALITRWDHNLGPVHRPFGSQAWTLDVDGQPIAVAVSASLVSATVSALDGTTWQRGEAVELARQCAAERWANRVMIRLWREVAAHRWPYWPVKVAVSYSQNNRHDGDLYRFDGWERASDQCGSMGGGAWSRPRYATDAVVGKKTCWLWRYDHD